MGSETDDIRDEVSLTDGPIDADIWGKVTRQTPRDEPGFALSIGRPIDDDAPDGIRASVFTEAAVDFAEDRYDVDAYEDDTPVGILLMDTDAYDAVFVGLGDVVGFEYEGDRVQGGVAVIGRSGTLRVRGVGAVDIEPEDVIEVLERADV